MDNQKKYDVIIVGGGISGIAALHRVKRDFPHQTVLLIEKEDHLGGLVRSSFEQGYLLETGPTAYLKNYQFTMQLVDELGLADQVIYNRPGADHRYIYRQGQIHPLPENPFSFLFSPLLSTKGKLRVLLEPFIGRGKKKEETVYHFAKRRFGKEVASTIMDAFVSGVCAGDVKRLDIHSLFPRIAQVEKKVRSFLLFLMIFKLKTLDQSANSAQVTFRSLKRGMGQIGEAAEELYPQNILLSTKVVGIGREGYDYLIHTGQGTFVASNLIMATAANVAAPLLKSIHPKISHHLAAIPYSPIITCQMGFKRSQITHPLDGFGFLIPRHLGVRILGGLFASGLFEGRAPQEDSSLKVYIGGTHDPEVLEFSDEQLYSLIEEELRPILGIEGSPSFKHVKRIKSAIPQYHLGHQRIVQALQGELKDAPHLQLIGNYLTGISVNEAVKLGFEIKMA